VFEESDIGWHPTYLFFIVMLAIAPALVYITHRANKSESTFAKRVQVFSNSSLMAALQFVFGAAWLLLVANVALVFLRLASGRNFVILLWLPLEAQYHLIPIDLVNAMLSS
jgi:hypothetical protein